MQRNADLIVSVESRKGGVGKTTAALCLARILRNRGYAVLVLDMDVTGTNAADIADSPFWKDDLYVIHEMDKERDGNGKPPPVNLLSLFERCFMTGKTVPEFVLSKSNCQGMVVNFGKVNVLGSQIYKRDAENSAQKNGRDTKKGNETTCIERPSILFDDLHTLWLLEFVHQIINDFIRIAKTETSTLYTKQTTQKVAVIIDNSPGYVGIAPAIHEWLTDRGPDCSKFLIVTSLDTQDLCACEHAVTVLHNLYKNKWEASREYVKACADGEDFPLAKRHNAFFMRLGTSARHEFSTGDPLAFYRCDKEKSPVLLEKARKGQEFYLSPFQYIAAIINRVPRAVKRGHLAYTAPAFLEQDTSPWKQLFGDPERGQGWREQMICYDEYIENQFLLQSLQRGKQRRAHRVHYLIEVLTMGEHDLHGGNDGTSNERPIQFALVEEDDERFMARIEKAQNTLTHARSAIDEAGFGHLARLIHDEWLPGSIVPGFRNMLEMFLRKSGVPYLEEMRFEHRIDDVVSENEGAFIGTLKKRMLMELHKSPFDDLEMIDDYISNMLAGVLAKLVGPSLISPMQHKVFAEDVVGLLVGVLAIELKHWSKRWKSRPERSSLQHFLAQESIKESDAKDDIIITNRFNLIRPSTMSDFAEVYKACASAQARLIDFAADSRFLLQLFRFIVERELKTDEVLFPFVRGIAESVIIDKTLPHEDAIKKMANALQAIQYFSEFDGVLEKILRRWGVVTHG